MRHLLTIIALLGLALAPVAIAAAPCAAHGQARAMVTAPKNHRVDSSASQHASHGMSTPFFVADSVSKTSQSCDCCDNDKCLCLQLCASGVYSVADWPHGQWIALPVPGKRPVIVVNPQLRYLTFPPFRPPIS